MGEQAEGWEGRETRMVNYAYRLPHVDKARTAIIRKALTETDH